MNRSTLKTSIAAFVLCCAALPAPSAAQKSDIDWQRMDRDLEIMQGVLDKMLSPYSSGHAVLGSRVHGIYLEGYGVLFQADIKPDLLAGFRLDNQDLDVYVNDNKTVVRVTPGGNVDALATDTEPEKKDTEAEVRRQVEDFLANYAGAIGQLTEEDRVSVLVNVGDLLRQLHIGAPGSKLGGDQKTLQMSALKKDIEALRREKLSDSEFRSRIQVSNKDVSAGGKQELDIMANILQTALSKSRDSGIGALGSQGAYLPGLGAVFFISGDAFPRVDLADLPKKLEAYLGEGALQEHRKEAKRSEAEMARNFRETLISLAGSYGHTLSALAPDEQLIIAVDFGRTISFGPSEDPERLLFQAKKKDLDAYNRSKINLEDFKSRVRFRQL